MIIPEEQENDAERGIQTVSEPLKQLSLNSAVVKPKDFIDLDENVCVTAELTEVDIVS